MIAAMKQISLSIDISESKEITESGYTFLPYFQNFFSNFAFIFDPTTLIFGPVITYGQFQQMKRNLKQEILEHSAVSFCN
ncbi:hypothetical protein Mgra_00009218 [Meloidogyne graminicola]|uniref:Uncharacterized protein n=1 Tax=Meloidogyne graminicola TaxID=189291 RepID=A0A8S9ZDL3_9BILA|nr:hypothetical protein Mgra_00009218 [Meloidogyne graminicola]